MAETSGESGSDLSNRSVAVALITLTRYLARLDPSLARYLKGSLENAQAAGLTEADLAILRLLIGAIGR